MPPNEPERYVRQIALTEIGREGQRRLREASVLIVGCGALGTAQAELLTRAGIGRLAIVDHDLVEIHNLPRVHLFDEDDVTEHRPKVMAATRKLRRINSETKIEERTIRMTAENVEQLVLHVDLILDATDNFETRFLLNDACVKSAKPWIYGGVVGVTGLSLVIRPADGPCLRCVMPELPPGDLPTCEELGVLGAMPTILAAWQVTRAIELLTGHPASEEKLWSFDIWRGLFSSLAVKRNEACPCCVKREFEFLKV